MGILLSVGTCKCYYAMSYIVYSHSQFQCTIVGDKVRTAINTSKFKNNSCIGHV